MPGGLAAVVCGNLESLEPLLALFQVECHLDTSGNTLVQGPLTAPGVWDETSQRWKQKELIYFRGLQRGVSYKFRARVIPQGGGPPSSYSGFATQDTNDNDPPAVTYLGASVTKVHLGFNVDAAPTPVSTDISSYDLHWLSSSLGFPDINQQPNKKTVPKLVSSTDGKFFIAVPATVTATIYLWVRAVDMDGNKQDWVSLGSFDPLDAFTQLFKRTPTLAQNVLMNPSWDDGLVYWKSTHTALSGNTAFTSEGIPVFSGTKSLEILKSDVQEVDVYAADEQGNPKYFDVQVGQQIRWGGVAFINPTINGIVPNQSVRYGVELTDKNKQNPTIFYTPDCLPTFVFLLLDATIIIPSGKRFLRFFAQMFGAPRTDGGGNFVAIPAIYDDAYLILPIPTNTLATKAVDGNTRKDGVINQDIPENRLWNNWFQGTANVAVVGNGTDGQPAAPTGYTVWKTHTSQGVTPSFTGDGQLNLNTVSDINGFNGVREEVNYEYSGLPGEEVIFSCQVQHRSPGNVPNGNFQLRIMGVQTDALTETGSQRTASFAGSDLETAYDTVVLQTTFPVDVVSLRFWRFSCLQFRSTNSSFRIRRGQVARAASLSRWTSAVARDPLAQFPGTPPSGGSSGGGGGGDPPPDKDCVVDTMWLDAEYKAMDAVVGMNLQTWQPDTGLLKPMPILFTRPGLQWCLHLTYENGTEVQCSLTTPLRTRDGRSILPHEAMDEILLTIVDDRLEWSRVVDVKRAGKLRVQRIDMGAQIFPAGVNPRKRAYTHNAGIVRK